jgi:hypothetical protein
MINGVLRHCTEMKVEKQFVDTHGQNEVAFGFCHLLGFQLMPRLKNMYAQRLAHPETGKPEAYPNLQLILSKPIDWDLIREQYDQMIKYATALRLGTTETEAILRRFTPVWLKRRKIDSVSAVPRRSAVAYKTLLWVMPAERFPYPCSIQRSSPAWYVCCQDRSPVTVMVSWVTFTFRFFPR